MRGMAQYDKSRQQPLFPFIHLPHAAYSTPKWEREIYILLKYVIIYIKQMVMLYILNRL